MKKSNMTEEEATVLIDMAMSDGPVLRELGKMEAPAELAFADWGMAWRPALVRDAWGNVEDRSSMDLQGLVPSAIRRKLVDLGVRVEPKQIEALMRSIGWKLMRNSEGAWGYVAPSGLSYVDSSGVPWPSVEVSLHDYEGSGEPSRLDEEVQVFVRRMTTSGDYEVDAFDYNSLNDALDEIFEQSSTYARIDPSGWTFGTSATSNPGRKRRLMR